MRSTLVCSALQKIQKSILSSVLFDMYGEDLEDVIGKTSLIFKDILFYANNMLMSDPEPNKELH